MYKHNSKAKKQQKQHNNNSIGYEPITGTYCDDYNIIHVHEIIMKKLRN